MINYGNRTEWSPIRSVIILWVINKIGLPLRGRLICLITSMITDRIGRHEVLLPINHIYNKIREIKRRKHTGEGIDNSFTCEIGKRKKELLERALWRVLSNFLGMTRTLSNYTVLLMLKSWLVIVNQIRIGCGLSPFYNCCFQTATSNFSFIPANDISHVQSISNGNMTDCGVHFRE